MILLRLHYLIDKNKFVIFNLNIKINSFIKLYKYKFLENIIPKLFNSKLVKMHQINIFFVFSTYFKEILNLFYLIIFIFNL